ncbi:neuroligin-1-like [Harmonia axyridis]|uniref:neuroligin-1-like n=1 Tax=Harmonia axyridis TaxID=115357 RepID=UPI001E278772|nr:neuroligin-1-like [Harmonia axyridis]XP_045472245.1 neuroligin-1-like [Harmonia axyridis]XP_045472246.1 neuroligin-1-like [Harmonia axyridis]
MLQLFGSGTTTLVFSVLLLLAVSFKEAVSSLRYSSRIVDTQSGGIRGIILELNSRHLEPVEVFRGVPYAAPPVGNLRFEPPQPPLPWAGTRLADTFGAVCPQKLPDLSNRTAALQHMPKGRYNFLKKLLPLLEKQSEDCLFLNMYIPGSGNRGLEAPYSVMVFVHGESFEFGAGHPYDGSVVSSYGHVIVVTLNYRLGILGLLRTRPAPDVGRSRSSSTSGGNLAVKDIDMALRWVKLNIASFGGDPNRIILVGHDTGAALVNFLLVAPSSKGLFSRVILLSGSALSPWATTHNGESIRLNVGRQTGCISVNKTNEEEDITHCLKSRSLEELMDVQLDTVRFIPRIAPSLPIDERAPDPLYAMEHSSETFITCEVMIGVTTTESYNDFNANDIQYGFEEDQRNRILRTYIRNTYMYHLNEIFSAVRNEYTDWDKPIQHPINVRDSTMEALSDGHTVAPLVHVGYLHARRGAKTYFFHFSYQTKEGDYPQRLGSVRGEDLIYILGMPLVGGHPFFPQNFTRQDMGVSEALLNFFSNFAKCGDPNGCGTVNKDVPDYGTIKEKTRYKSISWDPYEVSTQYYLSITSKPKMRSHYRGHKMAVWLNLIPQLHQPGDDVSMRHHHFHEREPHFYSGPVRPESLSHMPPPLFPAPMTDSHANVASGMGGSNTECISSTTEEDIGAKLDIRDGDVEENEEILQQLASRNYYSYTAALGVTVGVGCLLLVLNMLIYAGIYYQRDRRRKDEDCSIQLSSIPTSSEMSCQQGLSCDSIDQKSKQNDEMPPRYSTRGPPEGQNTSKKEKPLPPVRTSSSISNATVKKRVQIQEISV